MNEDPFTRRQIEILRRKEAQKSFWTHLRGTWYWGWQLLLYVFPGLSNTPPKTKG